MFRIDHEKWIDVPFWIAYLFAIIISDFFSLFITAILIELNIPIVVLAIVWFVLVFVLPFIFTVLTRKMHARWLKNRKRETENLNTPNSNPESEAEG